MSKMQTFVFEDPLPSWLMDALQEIVSTDTGNILLRVFNSTTIEVPAGSGSAQAGLSIDGFWRYNSATVQRAHPGGAAGAYDIFVTASNNNIVNTPHPGTDITVYAFGLDIKTAGATPTIVPGTVDRYRLVGQLTWDGSAITDLRPAVDSVRATDPLRPAATLDTTVPLEAHGKSTSQSADLFRLRKNAGGTVQFSVSNVGVINALGGATFGGALAVTGGATFTGGTVNAAGYQVSGSALAASHLSNGVTGSGAVALAASPAFTGTPTAPTASGDTNTTQLATTAFVIGQAYAKLASPTFTGTPAAPTAAVDTSTTQLATTAFVVGQASGSNPLMDGSVAQGTSLRYARQDHVHPSDTSRAALASPTFTGTPAAPTAAVDTSTTQIATTAYVVGQGYAKLASPTLTGTPSAPTAAPGTSTTQLATTAFVTTADNLKANLASPTFTGTPAAPTAAQATSTTQIATTAFVQSQASAPSSAVQVRDVGEAGQIRAGRDLTVADFTSMGLSAPLGLWSFFGGLTADTSGNARNLTVKSGFESITPGIGGAAGTAAVFRGNVADALYINNAAWQQITTGSWGCWFRTAKRGTDQMLVTKWSTTLGNLGYQVVINALNQVSANVSTTGSDIPGVSGNSDVCDERWHHAIATFDGNKLRLYVDGALEGTTLVAGTIFASTLPLNIGARAADGATAAQFPHFGRIDEAFLTPDVLSDDQVRNLYCASITHALGAVPSSAALNVRRRKRGAALATTDFPSTPLRLHNFTAGAITDQGSNNVTLVPGSGTSPTTIAGPDGVALGAYHFTVPTAGFMATDTGLPTGTASHSAGCWFKTTNAANSLVMLAWGGLRLNVGATLGGGVLSVSTGVDHAVGPFVSDGQWHFVVATADNAPADGVRRKVYLDGRLVGTSLVYTALALTGANAFRVGASETGGQVFQGQVDAAFVIGVALSPEQIRNLYNLGTQTLAVSPKAEGDHVEAMEATRLLVTLDTLEGCDQIDLKVSA